MADGGGRHGAGGRLAHVELQAQTHPNRRDKTTTGGPRAHGQPGDGRCHVAAARSGPRVGACRFLLLAGYENLAAPLFALARQCKLEVTVPAAPGGAFARAMNAGSSCAELFMALDMFA
jgi:hypothetical protein